MKTFQALSSLDKIQLHLTDFHNGQKKTTLEKTWSDIIF